jgi:hypothetical protein
LFFFYIDNAKYLHNFIFDDGKTKSWRCKMKVKLSNELLGITWEGKYSAGLSPSHEDINELFDEIVEVLKKKGFKRKLKAPQLSWERVGFIQGKCYDWEEKRWREKHFVFILKVSRKDSWEKLRETLKEIGFKEVGRLGYPKINQFSADDLYKDTVDIPFEVDMELTKEEIDLLKNARNLHEIQDLLYTISFFREIRIGVTGASKFSITIRKGKFEYVDLDFGGAYKRDMSCFADWCEGETQNCAEEVLNVLREVLLEL